MQVALSDIFKCLHSRFCFPFHCQCSAASYVSFQQGVSVILSQNMQKRNIGKKTKTEVYRSVFFTVSSGLS